MRDADARYRPLSLRTVPLPAAPAFTELRKVTRSVPPWPQRNCPSVSDYPAAIPNVMAKWPRGRSRHTLGYPGREPQRAHGGSYMKCLSLAATLMLVTASAGSDAATWAKSGIEIEGTCDGPMPVVSPPVKSPDKTAEVALRCKTLNRDNAEIALTIRHAGRVLEIPLPMTVRDGWRPQELLWSPEGKQLIVNGSQNAYAGYAFVVIDLRDPNPTAKEITESAQWDMVRRFPPCKAAKHERELCRRVEHAPHFNMSAITWTRDSHSLVVMAEVPSSSAYGGIMGQVEGYEIDSGSGRILERLGATELKARWQSEMAFRMEIPERATYEP